MAIVTPSSKQSIVPRLRAELAALGFSVLEARSVADASPSELEELARKLDVLALVGVGLAQRDAEVVIVDRVTGKTSRRTVNDASSMGEDVLAIRAVELLRASLLEVDSQIPARGEVPPPRVVRRVVARDRPKPVPAPVPRQTVFAALGPLLLAAPGGVPASVHTYVEGGALWGDFRLSAVLIAPTLPSEVCTAAGCAAVSFAAVGPSVDWELAEGPVVPSLGAQIAAFSMRMEGHATAPSRDQNVALWAILGLARAAVRIDLSRNVELRALAFGGVTLPELAMNFAGERVASVGRPLVGGAVTGGVRW